MPIWASLGVTLKKQGPIQHKPWSIQTFTNCQENCRRSRQLQSVKTISDCQYSFRLAQHFQALKTVEDCEESYNRSSQIQTVKTNTVSQSVIQSAHQSASPSESYAKRGAITQVF